MLGEVIGAHLENMYYLHACSKPAKKNHSLFFIAKFAAYVLRWGLPVCEYGKEEL